MVSSILRRSLALTVVLLLLGCSGRSSRDPDSPRVQRNILTYEMAVETRTTNAYDVVMALRSNWLLTRGVDSFSNPGQVLVYFNNTRLGGVETLRAISLNQIGYIQYFDGTDAAGIWGLDHGHGVIAVSTLQQN